MIINNLMPDTVSFDEKSESLVIIDQTKLPGSLELLRLTEPEQIYSAIKALRVRGAPAIGVAAAIGAYVASNRIITDDKYTFYESFLSITRYLASSRPTAVNLFWALDRMERTLEKYAASPVEEIRQKLKTEALKIRDEDVESCRKIGEYGFTLLKKGARILTVCNAGGLAAVRYGTALSPVHIGNERGYDFSVFACETRPLLQGARLTAFELSQSGIKTTLICDNMASYVMKHEKIDAVLAGADRIAANGDVCNKIGTSALAVLAKYYGIPFYVLAPVSTIDKKTENGSGIVIEQRDESELSEMWYKQKMTPDGIGYLNPAFDITENSLVSAIITDKGILYPPYSDSIL